VGAASYVRSFCAIVVPFAKDIAARSAALGQTPIANAAQAKTAYQGFLSAVAADTQHALSQLRGAGQPNVTNGKAISAAIVNAFSQLTGAMTRAVAQAKALPTGSAAAFRAAAQSLGTNVRSAMTSIGTSLTTGRLRSPQLEQAAAKTPACKSIGP